ncbi:MAG TPA: hypothetical protein DDY78_17785 [Planctomycetales bacterium]|nr:hypothetical protein [Planctomycetales bacterium]
MFRHWFSAVITGLTVLTASACARADGPSPRFLPPHRPDIPKVQNKSWCVNPIDAFILARLEAAGLAPSPRAEKLRLLRRVTFDLTGLPPALEEQDAFLKDASPDAYSKVVERLLASPHYGERWASHWLDLVRYAETDGFKADDLRPEAYRYRDYVIRSFNADLPYDRFVRQQIAGDEMEPDNADAIIATGFNRLWPDEYNAANLEQRRQEILDDVTDTAGLAFLGMTFGCARCHDHKFDPIPQADYYRLQAFFAPMRQRDDAPALDGAARKDYQTRLAAWEAATKDIRAEMDALVADKREEARKHALTKFREEIQQAERTSEDKRTPYQRLIALMAEQQMDRAAKDAAAKLPDDKKKHYHELEQKLAAVEPRRPVAPPLVMSVCDVGLEAPPTYRLQGGDWRRPKEEVPAGFPIFLGGTDATPAPPAGAKTTGRRSALAVWLTRKDNPQTARVMVNRLWQHHFGVGIVATPSDFGVMGEPATHPELLDWLTVEFMENGWSIKHMHRLMVLSAAYCQDSHIDRKDARCAKAWDVDRDDHLLWHMRRQRLEGEAVHDAMLAATSELNPRMFGVSARPKLPERISSYAWKADAKPEDQNRRSIYVFAKRNLRYPLFDAFDLPDMHNSCACRAVTTTAPQALLLLNGDFALERGRRLGADLASHFPSDNAALAARAYQTAWGRPAADDEVKLAVRFLTAQTAALHSRDAAVADFCHALLNANEFLYVD